MTKAEAARLRAIEADVKTMGDTVTTMCNDLSDIKQILRWAKWIGPTLLITVLQALGIPTELLNQ